MIFFIWLFCWTTFVLSSSELLYLIVPGIYVLFGSQLIPKSQSIITGLTFITQFNILLIFYYNLLANLAAAYNNGLL